MRKVFSSYVQSQTMLVRDALARGGIEVTVLNENEAMSPVPAFQASTELWATRDADYDAAARIVTATMAALSSRAEAPSWVCSHCHETNPATFEICWSCGTDRDGAAGQARP